MSIIDTRAHHKPYHRPNRHGSLDWWENSKEWNCCQDEKQFRWCQIWSQTIVGMHPREKMWLKIVNIVEKMGVNGGKFYVNGEKWVWKIRTFSIWKRTIASCMPNEEIWKKIGALVTSSSIAATLNGEFYNIPWFSHVNKMKVEPIYHSPVAFQM